MGKDFDVVLRIAGPVVVLVAMALFFIYAGDRVGMPSNAADVFIALVPGFMVLIVSALTIPRRGVFAVAGFSGLGIGFAILVGAMYNQNIVSDEMLTGLTIGEEQMLIIGVLTAIGIVNLVMEDR